MPVKAAGSTGGAATRHPADRWGRWLLALSLPVAALGLYTRQAFVLAVGVIAFFTGLWCLAVARVARNG